LKIIHLIEEQQERIWNDYENFEEVFAEVGAPFPPKEHLAHIKSKSGEKIIIYSERDSTILGWIGIIPDSENMEAELAGIEVHTKYRVQGYGKQLINLAQSWLTKRGINKFKFQTSPLFTSNSLLYLKSFRTKYIWNNQNYLPPDNIPWPVVDCEMEWPIVDPKIKIKNIEKSIDHSLLKWDGLKPYSKKENLNPGKPFQILEVQLLRLPTVFQEFRNGNIDVAKIPFEAFEWLNNNEYEFMDFQKYNKRFYFLFNKNGK